MSFDCAGCGQRHSTVDTTVPLCHGCSEAHVELVPKPKGFMPALRWRDEAPSEVEIADPRIIGWAFRYTVNGTPQSQVSSDLLHIRSLMMFKVSFQWCPIYAPEEP